MNAPNTQRTFFPALKVQRSIRRRLAVVALLALVFQIGFPGFASAKTPESAESSPAIANRLPAITSNGGPLEPAPESSAVDEAQPGTTDNVPVLPGQAKSTEVPPPDGVDERLTGEPASSPSAPAVADDPALLPVEPAPVKPTPEPSDPNPDPAPESAPIDVQPIEPVEPAVPLLKGRVTAPTTLEAGQPLVYTVEWSINGSSSEIEPSLVLKYPASTTFVNASGSSKRNGNVVRWSELGESTAGAETLTIEPDPSLADGTTLEAVGQLCAGPTEAPGCLALGAKTTILNRPTIALTKTVDKTTAHPGDRLTYSLAWSVGGTGTTSNTRLTDEVPANVSLASPPTGNVFDPATNAIAWELGAQPADASGTVSWTGVIATPLTDGIVLTETATLTADNLDSAFSSATTTVVSGASLGLTKTVNRATAQPGETLTYTLAWTIGGTDAAASVILTDPIPANLTYATISAGGLYDPNARTLSWSLGNRQPGDSGTATWTAEILSPLADGSVVTNTATLAADGLTPVNATATTTVSSSAVFTLDKTADQATARPGATVTYTLDWSVAGSSPVTDLTLSDALPAGLTFASASNNGAYRKADRTVQWSIGNAVPGDSGSLTVSATIDTEVTIGATLTNTATLSAKNADEVTDTADLDVGGRPILSLGKKANVRTARPGETIVYTVVVRNTGTAAATEVAVTDILPAGFVFLESGESDRAFTIGALEAASSRTLTYSVVIGTDVSPGTYRNLATVTAANHKPRSDPATIEVQSLAQVSRDLEPNVTVTKTANRATVATGGVVAYTLTIRNNGLAPAYNVRVTDTLPASFTFIDHAGPTATWRIGDLLPGHSRVINVDVRVGASAAAGRAMNTVRVIGDNFSAVEASASVTVQAGQVLGALATTGPGPIDFVFFSSALVSLAIGFRLLRRRKTTREVSTSQSVAPSY